MERKEEDMRQDLSKMREDVIDLQRQLHKRCILMWGPHVPDAQEKEETGAIFARFARTKYNISVLPCDIAAVHRLGAKKIIAEFVYRTENSVFQRLLRAAYGPQTLFQKSVHVFFDQKKSSHDLKLKKMAEKLYREKKIERFMFDCVSGKLRVRVTEDKKLSNGKRGRVTFWKGMGEKELEKIADC